MSISIQREIKERLKAAINKLYDIKIDDLIAEVPPRTELGDLAFPVAFELAKRLKARTGAKHNPRQIAESLAKELRDLSRVSRVEIAGAGFLNIFLDRPSHLRDLLPQPGQIECRKRGVGKLIVEHTAINPNKAAHIGHLRNAILGDTVVRLLRACGEEVEVQNYIDNTGVQVADVVVGFKYLENKTLDDIKREHPLDSGKFDYYCWDLYARVGQFYQENEENLKLRARALHEIEEGDNETAEMAEYISTRILNCHLDTMLRLGIEYDLLPRESDILRLNFWTSAFERLKQSGAIVFETEGRNKGCWVMKSEQLASGNGTVEPPTPDAGRSDIERSDEYDIDKVIVRSNGTVTYVGKDIAYHLWKLGKLGLDFYYKPLRTYPDGHTVWITTSDRAEASDGNRPKFGNGQAFLSVIGIEQAYTQNIVKQGILACTGDPRVERSAHLGYEKVTLSPASCLELGIELSQEEMKRAQIGMSGRRGLGVKADDLIDKLEERALEEVRSRNPDINRERQRDIAHKIAVGALRYFLSKYTRTSVITFDFKEALAFEGETGPYLQYSVVRANNIFRKLREAGIETEGLIEKLDEQKLEQLLTGPDGNEWWALAYWASRLTEVIEQAASAYEPAYLAKYLFQLAQKFNLFYHNYRIISETDEAKRALLISIVDLVRRQLTTGLAVMGIEVPERM